MGKARTEMRSKHLSISSHEGSMWHLHVNIIEMSSEDPGMGRGLILSSILSCHVKGPEG